MASPLTQRHHDYAVILSKSYNILVVRIFTSLSNTQTCAKTFKIHVLKGIASRIYAQLASERYPDSMSINLSRPLLSKEN